MKKLVIATSVALALSSASAFAVTQQSGVYINALGGWSFAESPSASNATINVAPNGYTQESSPTNTNNKNYTWGGNIGYQYAFTSNWAAGIEAGYANFGKTEYTFTVPAGSSGNFNYNLSSAGFQIMAVGSYLMSNGLNAFLKAGAIDQETQTTNNSLGAVAIDTNGDTKTTQWIPAVAVGIGYMPIQNLNVALQYERTFGDNWNSSNYLLGSSKPKPITQNAVTLGLSYTFPLSF